MLRQEKILSHISFGVFVTIKPSSAEQWYPSIIRNCVSVDDGSYVCKHFVLSTLRNCQSTRAPARHYKLREWLKASLQTQTAHGQTSVNINCLSTHEYTDNAAAELLPQGTKCLTYENWSIGSRQTVQIGQKSWRLYRYCNYIIANI